MALELIAVQGMTVVVDQTTVNPPGFAVVATIVVNPPSSTKCKGESKLMHRDGDQITVTAITVPAAGATIPDAGPYTVSMNAAAQFVKAEGALVLREGDLSDTINATPQIPGTPPTDYPVSFKCIVQTANQTKAKAK